MNYLTSLPFQPPVLAWSFACSKKQGAGCIWDWPYPLTSVSNMIRKEM